MSPFILEYGLLYRLTQYKGLALWAHQIFYFAETSFMLGTIENTALRPLKGRNKKGLINYDKFLKGNILRHRISWNNEFNCRDNHGPPLVVFRLAMVVCSLRISRGIFLD
jgi:hypothetical protein